MIFTGHAAIVNLLLKFGADLDTAHYSRKTPLHCAAMSGAVEVFRLLVESGANFNAVGPNGRTPLDCPHLQCPTSNYILIIERHMTKMAAAKLPYTKMASYRPGVMDLDAKRLYRKECVAELSKLENHSFPGAKITLKDFLTQPHAIHRYIRNNDVCEIVSELNFIADYPIYGRLLEHNLFKGLRRLALLENTSIFFSATQHFAELPLECFEKICSFLDDRTLSYLGLVWAWSQSKSALSPPSPHAANSGVAITNNCMEKCMGSSMASSMVCSLASRTAYPNTFCIAGLCISRYASPQPSNSIS